MGNALALGWRRRMEGRMGESLTLANSQSHVVIVLAAPSPPLLQHTHSVALPGGEAENSFQKIFHINK